MALGKEGLLRFLEPESIAVVGGKEAAKVVRQCRKSGYAGRIWSVNPNRERLEGLTCHPDLESLPEAPDCAFVAVPAAATVDAVAELSAMGAGGAVCYASGFSEIGGEGVKLQERLVEAAGDLPLLGPNCHGYLNMTAGAALWPDQFGFEKRGRGVAIVTQSGNIGINLTMQRRRLPLAWMITLGNQAGVGAEECLEAAAASGSVTAVGMHLEGVRDLARFAAAAGLARENGVPVVALKAGRSEIGARIALGHTASLAGEDALYEALFDRLGVARADDLETFIETLKLLSIAGPVRGGRVTSLSCSGGEASLMADLSPQAGLAFPPLDDAHRARVQATLSERVRVDNPLDYHTFIWGDGGRMTECFSAMLDADFDFAFFVIDFPRSDQCDPADWDVAAEAAAEAARRTGTSAGVVATLGENMPEDVAERLAQRGIVPFCGMRQALHAVGAAWRASREGARGLPAPTFAGAGAAPADAADLDERQAKEILREIGLPIPEGRLAGSLDECRAAAAEIGYPVAVKGVAPGLAHKTEAGAVELGVADDAEFDRIAAPMLERFGRVMVERMIDGAAGEIVVGFDRDPHFGDYLVVGSGGTLVELLADRKILLLPTDAAAVREALAGLRLAPLLRGYRGRPEADLDAAAQMIAGLAGHPLRRERGILSVEINPLMVMPKDRPAGPGAWVADALMRAAPPRPGQDNPDK